MNEELLRLLQELLGSEVSRNTAVGSVPPYRTGPTEGDIDLIREENIRARLDEEERVMQYLREEAYRSGVDVPPDASMQRLREEVYRIPSPPRVEMFDPAVGGSMATTRDDP